MSVEAIQVMRFVRSPGLWAGAALLSLTVWGLLERQRDLVQTFDTLFGDEANTMACALHRLPECSSIQLSQFWRNITGTAWGGVPSTYFFILALLFKYFGATIYTSRMLEVVLGTLCIPLVYGICRQLEMRRRAALLAAGLFAASRWSMIATRIGWPNPMAAFTVALTVFTVLLAFRSRRPIWFVLSGLCIALCMNTYIAAHVVLLILPSWLLVLALIHGAPRRWRAIRSPVVGNPTVIRTAAPTEERQPPFADVDAVGARRRWRIRVGTALAAVTLLLVAGVRLYGYTIFPWVAAIWLLALGVAWPWLNDLAGRPHGAGDSDSTNANSRRWSFSRTVSAGTLVAIITFLVAYSPWLYWVHRTVLDAHGGQPPAECREPGVNTQFCLLRAELTRLELRAGTVFILSDFQRNVQWKSQHPDVPNDVFSILKWQTLTALKMFNVEGDANPLQNIPGYPMLDRLSGYLFAIGMMVVLWRWRRPTSLLILLWFWESLITSTILTENAPNANRAVVLVPTLYILIGAAIDLILTGADTLIDRMEERGVIGSRAAVAVNLAIFTALCVAAVFTINVNLRDFFVVYAADRSAYNGYNPRDTHWAYLARDLRAKSVVVYGSFAREQQLALAPSAVVLDATPRVADRDNNVCAAPQPPPRPDLVIVLNQEPDCYSESLMRDPGDLSRRPTPQRYIRAWENRLPQSKFQEAYDRYHDLMFYWMAPRRSASRAYRELRSGAAARY